MLLATITVGKTIFTIYQVTTTPNGKKTSKKSQLKYNLVEFPQFFHEINACFMIVFHFIFRARALKYGFSLY